MFDEDELSSIGSNDDDFDDYVDFIRALEEDRISRGEILHEMMDEFGLEKEEAVSVYKRYLNCKTDDEDDEPEDIVEDDDYGDGNSEK